MSLPQQQFTFIDVTAQTQANRKRIKSHVANDVNRKKRQIAVERYQSLRSAEALRTSHSATINASVAVGPVPLAVKPESTSSLDTASIIRPAPAPTLIAASTSSSLTRDVEPHDLGRSPILDGIADYVNSWTVFRSSLGKQGQSHVRVARSYGETMFRPRKRSSHDSIEIQSTILLDTLVSRSDGAGIPRIDAPTELNLIQSSLRNAKVFLRGKHESTWSHAVKEDPFHYQHDYEVGLWRECFFLAFDSLNMGKTSDALAILDVSLGATSALIKKQHPSLLNSLLEVIQEAKDVNDSRLSRMIQSYLVQITMTLLGVDHPVAVLMKTTQSRVMDEQHSLELLSDTIVDVMAELFGPNHFQTLGTIFGQTRHYMIKGNFKTAQSCLERVGKVWKGVFPEGSTPLQVIAVENAKVANAIDKTESTLNPSLDGAIAALHELAELTRSSDNHVAVVSATGTSGSRSSSLPLNLELLGRQLVSGSYHALSLYVYTHVDEIFAADNASLGSNLPDGGRSAFPSKVAQVLIRSHLQEQALKGGIHPQHSNVRIQNASGALRSIQKA